MVGKIRFETPGGTPINPAQAGIGAVTVTARVTRANGMVEDLGVVAEYKKGPFKRLREKLARAMKGS